MKILFTLLPFLVSCCFGQVQDHFSLLHNVPVYQLRPHQDTNVYSFTSLKMNQSVAINYLEDVAKLVNNKTQLLRSNSRNQYFQLLGTYLSFIGDYGKAIIQFDSSEYDGAAKQANNVAAFLPGLKSLTFRDARQVILDSARSHQVVMINEAHHFSRNRVLTYTLLQDLYGQGYRYFGLEALSPYQYDSSKPLSVFNGYYITEPVMGEVIRFAREIGYTVFPYEAMGGAPLARDSIQAANIAAVVGDFSKGKLLIHAGYGHIAERNFGVPALGNILKDLLHTDPFTVNQVDFIEGHRNSATQGLFNRLAAKRRDTVVMPLAMFTKDKPYQVSDDSLYDIYTYTPPAKYKNGRPTWLAANGIRSVHAVKLPKAALDTIFLVQAYMEKELESLPLGQAIPADQTYTFSGRSVSLYLRKGVYRIVFRNRNYDVVGNKSLRAD